MRRLLLALLSLSLAAEFAATAAENSILENQTTCREAVLFQGNKRVYDPELTRESIMTGATEDSRHSKNVSNLFCAIQLMYEQAADFRRKNPSKPDEYRLQVDCAHRAFREALLITYPQVDNTTHTLHLLASYIRYKHLFQEEAARTSERALVDWLGKYYARSGTSGTSNLELIARSKDYLLKYSGILDLRYPGIVGPRMRFGDPDGYLAGVASGIIFGGGPGEYASHPYGAQNMVPFLVLGSVAPNRQHADLFKRAFVRALDWYSYSWLDGHLVACSTRTYPVVVSQGVGHGLKSVLAYYFGSCRRPVKKTFKQGLNWIDLENHSLAAAVYPVNYADIQSAVSRAESPRVNPVMGKMHTNSSFWQYFLSGTYGVYTLSTARSRGVYIPGQTIPSGVLWKSRSARSNFFMAIPDAAPEAMMEKRDLFQEKRSQEWMQYGPTYVLATGNDRLSSTEISALKPFHNAIFGSMPNRTFPSWTDGKGLRTAPTTPNSVVDATYARLSSVAGKEVYRLFYSMSNEAPAPGTDASVFIAVTSAGPFTMGRDGRFDGKDGWWYPDFFTSLSFKIDLNRFGNRSMGVAVETARPSDFQGNSTEDRFNDFKRRILIATDFRFTPRRTIGATIKTVVEYRDLNRNTLYKEFDGNEIVITRAGARVNYDSIPWPWKEEVLFKME